MDIDERRGRQAQSLAPGQAGEGGGGLARLADGHGERVGHQGGGAIAELGRDLDIAGQAGQLFKGITADLGGVEGGTAGHDLDAGDRFEIDVLLEGPTVDEIQIGRERTLDAVGLFVDLLFHEVAVLALLDLGGRGRDDHLLTVHRFAIDVEHARAGPVEGDIVPLFQIADGLGEGADGQGIRAQIHFALAPADHQRAAAPRAEDHAVFALNQNGQGIGAGQPIEDRFEGHHGIIAAAERAIQQVSHNLGVGLALKGVAEGLELGLEVGEILDDAVVDQGHATRLVRVGVRCGRGAMGGPAGMADADGRGQGLGLEH